MKLAGVHLPNRPSTSAEHREILRHVAPAILLVCQDDFPLIPMLREENPGVFIVARVFGRYPDWDSWHLPWNDLERMADYGRFVADLANQFLPDAIQYANEPGIDDGDPSWWTPAGYERLARSCAPVVAGYRAAGGQAMLGTIPLSPGHLEDDGFVGAATLREVWQQHDLLLLHTYWTAAQPGSHLSDWYGLRYRRQLAAYAWEKDWAIVEFNRDEPAAPGDAERAAVAAETREWLGQIRRDLTLLAGRCHGACWFILDSGDPSFARLRLIDNPRLQAVLADDGRGGPEPPKGEPMPIPPAVLQMTIEPAGPLVPGQPFVLRIPIRQKDGDIPPFAAVFAITDYGLASDGVTAQAGPQTLFSRAMKARELATGGEAIVDGFVQPDIYELPCTLTIRAAGFLKEDGGEFDLAAPTLPSLAVPIVVGAASEAGPRPAPEPAAPTGPAGGEFGAASERSRVFYAAGSAYNRDGDHAPTSGHWLEIQRQVSAMGGPDDAPFAVEHPNEVIHVHAGRGYDEDKDPRWLYIQQIENAARVGAPLPPDPFVAPRPPTILSKAQIWQLAQRIAREEDVWESRWALAAMIEKESGWRADAVGDGGHSVGLTQLHDAGLGAGMSVDERKDPETNLRRAFRAHRGYLNEFGTIEAALAAHNAGGPAVRRAGGDWTAVIHHVDKKTGRPVLVADIYVRPILALADRFAAQGSPVAGGPE
ncbi:MAG: lytic transglycosylase domain-containing protein [Dehalococcoidia bacterium]